MKICVNCLLVEPGKTGGGETFLVNLVDRLSRLDRTNEYLLLVTQANAHLFATENPRFVQRIVISSAVSRAKRLWFEYQSLPHLLKRERIDLYYSPFGTLPRRLPCKAVVTFQNLLYLNFKENTPYCGNTPLSWLYINLQSFYYRLTARATLRRATRVWAVSKTTAQALTQRYKIPAEKIDVIYEGVSLDQFNPERLLAPLERPIQHRYVLIVASLYPNKNIDKAICAFRKLVDRGLPHELVIVGNDWHGYRDRLEALVKRIGLTHRVKFIGGVPHDQIAPYFQHAELFLMLSNVESFGLPVLEAMAAGVPVLISQRSSLPEIAGDAALTADIKNINHIADQMVRILTDRQLSHQLRERGWNRARNFDWNETAARALDMFNNVAGVKSEALPIQRKESPDESSPTRIPSQVS
jgi:glycosyltransferase involved in cell wall biosynthesis